MPRPKAGRCGSISPPGRQGAELSVTDQGRGLDADTLAELARPAGGTLPAGRSGLMLVRQILAEHQAVLEAENLDPPEHGTRLVMRFPVFWQEHGKEQPASSPLTATT
ncbi:hypothetical protein ACLG6S_01855 [Thermodesulfobacteriota bacterium B35]